MEKIIFLEEQLSINIDLLKIARDYCEFNQDKSYAISNLFSLIDIMLANQCKALTECSKIIDTHSLTQNK